MVGKAITVDRRHARRSAARLYTEPVGAWRSLVARGLWVAEVPGSNPGAPISRATWERSRWPCRPEGVPGRSVAAAAAERFFEVGGGEALGVRRPAGIAVEGDGEDLPSGEREGGDQQDRPDRDRDQRRAGGRVTAPDAEADTDQNSHRDHDEDGPGADAGQAGDPLPPFALDQVD